MANADLGISFAFWLIIASTLLCVWYGAVNWNKGAEEVVDSEAKRWANTEDRIDEDL